MFDQFRRVGLYRPKKLGWMDESWPMNTSQLDFLQEHDLTVDIISRYQLWSTEESSVFTTARIRPFTIEDFRLKIVLSQLKEFSFTRNTAL